MDIQGLQHDIQAGNIIVGAHALKSCSDDALDIDDVWAATVANGQIIEDYPTDPRGPNCLILCWIATRPVHACIAWSPQKGYAFMVTVYRPDSDAHWQWLNSYRTRGPRKP